MSQPVVYAIVAMVCYGLSDFIYKQAATAGIRPDHFLMAQAWFFCPLVILYALATNTFVFDPAALWGSLAGIFVFIGFFYFIRSLTVGSVSTNASIFRLNFIVTVVMVVAFLGEPLTPNKIAGLALALFATWLLLGAGASADRVPDDTRSRSLVQVAVATIAFGASNFFHTMGLRHGAMPETLAVAQAALFMPLATAVVYVADRKLRPPPVTFKYGADGRRVAARRHDLPAPECRGWPGERAGADRPDGVRRRRSARDFHPSRAGHRPQADRSRDSIGCLGGAGRKLKRDQPPTT